MESCLASLTFKQILYKKFGRKVVSILYLGCRQRWALQSADWCLQRGCRAEATAFLALGRTPGVICPWHCVWVLLKHHTLEGMQGWRWQLFNSKWQNYPLVSE